MALTAKQQRFVDEYLIDLNATQAATRAGYSRKTAKAIGSENLTKPDIAAEISRRQGKLAAKLEITAEAVIGELAKLGFANMADYMQVGEDGAPRLDFGNLTRDQKAALAEVTVEELFGGPAGGDMADTLPVRKVKFKLWDKRAALVDLGKHLGLFVDHSQVDHNVKILADRPLTADEWAERYAADSVEPARRPAKGAG